MFRSEEIRVGAYCSLIFCFQPRQNEDTGISSIYNGNTVFHSRISMLYLNFVLFVDFEFLMLSMQS